MGKHKDLGVKNKKHKPGCVTRHVGTYIKGNTCSHRWQAAQKAVGLPGTYAPLTATTWAWKNTNENLKKLKRWLSEGKATNKVATAAKTSFSVEPFATAKFPWPNNAHHIIPRNTIAAVWETISQKAKPRVVRCFNSMVTFALAEPYNLNDQPNMVMLPLFEKESGRLGLPRHLQGGHKCHSDYDAVVEAQVRAVIPDNYDGMVDNLKAKKHINKVNEPKVKDDLNEISEAVHSQIIAIAAANKNTPAGPGSLDDIAPQITF